jgi:hypothetical protein
MGVMVNPGTVRAHPLHVLASRDLPGFQVDPSKHCVVVGDVPYVIADVFESNVLCLFSIFIRDQ